MKFGEKVRDLRKKHSLTQDELAQCLGIDTKIILPFFSLRYNTLQLYHCLHYG